MKKFTVMWVLYVQADSSAEAAQIALERQRSRRRAAAFFSVRNWDTDVVDEVVIKLIVGKTGDQFNNLRSLNNEQMKIDAREFEFSEYVSCKEEELKAANVRIAQLTDTLYKIKWHRKLGTSPSKYEHAIESMAAVALAKSSGDWLKNNNKAVREQCAAALEALPLECSAYAVEAIRSL